MPVMAGVERGGAAHAVCVNDAREPFLGRIAVGHERAGLETLIARRQRHRATADIPVAIEPRSGLLGDALPKAGCVVTPVHPDLLKACGQRRPAQPACSVLAGFLQPLPPSQPGGR